MDAGGRAFQGNIQCKGPEVTVCLMCSRNWGFPVGSGGKESVHVAGDQDSIPGSERSLEKGMATSILQYSYLENPMDREGSRLQSMGSQRIRHC